MSIMYRIIHSRWNGLAAILLYLYGLYGFLNSAWAAKTTEIDGQKIDGNNVRSNLVSAPSPQQKVVQGLDQSLLQESKKWTAKDFHQLALFKLMEFAKKYPQRVEEPLFKKMLDRALDRSGTLALYVYAPDFISGLQNSTVGLHLAHLAFKQKKYSDVLTLTGKVETSSSFHPEALLLKGSAQDQLGEVDNAKSTFQNCEDSAQRFALLTKFTPFKRYFTLIKENCLLNRARIEYRLKNFDLSIDLYRDIDKRSYSWPYTLQELAWAYYQKKDYNRSLGLVMTYRSPLLSSYFFPESEVLQALNYFRLCYYRESVAVIDQYYRVYQERAKLLKQLIDAKSGHESFFFQLLTSNQSLEEAQRMDGSGYLTQLRSQLKKQLKLQIHLSNYERAKKELDRAKIMLKPEDRELQFLTQAVSNMEKLINRHALEYVYYFLNSIHYFSYEMFNLKLEIISRKKDLIYENKKLASTRAIGSFDHVKQGKYEFFYKFNGEFWADELGDYSFGLKNNCKAIKDERLDPLYEKQQQQQTSSQEVSTP